MNDELARYRALADAELTAFARARLGPDNRASLLYVPRETADIGTATDTPEAA